jgi:hypothetical protein
MLVGRLWHPLWFLIRNSVLRRRNRLKAIADAQRTPEELLTMRADPDNRANYVYTIWVVVYTTSLFGLLTMSNEEGKTKETTGM